jgi:hypothetical protein
MIEQIYSIVLIGGVVSLLGVIIWGIVSDM